MKNPLSLEKLPEYLKNIKENENTDDCLVVDMGKVITKRSYQLNYIKIFFLIAIVLFSIDVSAIIYRSTINKEITVVVDVNESNVQSVSEIISEVGGEVIAIEENIKNKYKVKISKLKNVNSFIKNLSERKEIKNIEVEK